MNVCGRRVRRVFVGEHASVSAAQSTIFENGIQYLDEWSPVTTQSIDTEKFKRAGYFRWSGASLALKEPTT